MCVYIDKTSVLEEIVSHTCLGIIVLVSEQRFGGLNYELECLQ